MSVVNKASHWLSKLPDLINTELEEIFGERGKSGKFETHISVDNVEIPRGAYNAPTITVSEFQDRLLPTVFKNDVYEIYFDITDEIYNKILPRNKESKAIKNGLTILKFNLKNAIQMNVYRNLEVGVEPGDIAKRSGIEIVNG